MKTFLIIVFVSSIGFAKWTPDPKAGFDPIPPEEQEEFDQLVDGLVQQVCFYDVQLTQAKETITRQKAIQKQTGTVDLKAIHHAGEVVVDVTEAKKRHTDLFRKIMGKELKNYDCP